MYSYGTNIDESNDPILIQARHLSTINRTDDRPSIQVCRFGYNEERTLTSFAILPTLQILIPSFHAIIYSGNSGGPLLDSSGNLIGMNTAIYSPSGASAGVGFAIPIDSVKMSK